MEYDAAKRANNSKHNSDSEGTLHAWSLILSFSPSPHWAKLIIIHTLSEKMKRAQNRYEDSKEAYYSKLTHR